MRVFPLPPSAKAVAEGFTSTSAAGKSEIAAVKDELDAAEAELTEAKSELTAAEASDNEQKVANAKRDVNRVREEVESLSKSRNPAQARSDRLTESLTDIELAARSAFSKYTRFVASAVAILVKKKANLHSTYPWYVFHRFSTHLRFCSNLGAHSIFNQSSRD